MAIAKNQVVSIEYEVKEAATDAMIDSNIGREPLEFMMGYGHIIQGLEEAIASLSAGESLNVVVPAAKAYGEYRAEMTERVEREQFAGIDLQVGMTLYGQAETGQTVQVVVKEFDDSNVTIDYNHPLAGKDLKFYLKILALREATTEEIERGSLARSCGGCGEDGSCCGEHERDPAHDCGCPR
ncbi:MAG: peptidylprolyl isomerase [Helicobacteraceae bacterium]|jgi:FKBP-type peptidyl-prolyl cis-trans isomerase SlyD|nr:peptidylprolyl isomerase [Helicobacteraceae bacterium]